MEEIRNFGELNTVQTQTQRTMVDGSSTSTSPTFVHIIMDDSLAVCQNILHK